MSFKKHGKTLVKCKICASWGHLGDIVGLRGWSWEHFGALKVRLGAFGRSCGVFGRSWGDFGRLGVDLGASWAILNVLVGLLGVSWGCLEGVLGTLVGFWGLLAAMSGIWELVLHSQHAESQINKLCKNAVKH